MYNAFCFLMQLLILSVALLGSFLLGESGVVAFLALQLICANILVLKLVVLFGIEVTTCDAYAIFAMIAVNLLREFYGPDSALRSMLISLFLGLMVCLLLFVHNHWLPSFNDQMHGAYQILLDPVTRVFEVSLVVSLITWFIDYSLFSYLTNIYHSLALTTRMTASILISQALDTFLFTLWALGPWIVDFWSIFLWSYSVKVLTVICVVPFVTRLLGLISPRISVLWSARSHVVI